MNGGGNLLGLVVPGGAQSAPCAQRLANLRDQYERDQLAAARETRELHGLLDTAISRIRAYDRLVTAAIDPEAQFQTVADVRAFLLAGLPECRQ